MDPGAGGDVVATDDVVGVHYQRVKLTDGTAEATTAVAAGGGVEANALRVTVANDSTGVLSVDDNGSTLSVDDGAGSLTVDNAALSVVGGGVEATAQRVTLANDSTGVLSVDDNGGTLTVDNAALSVVGGGTEATALRVTVANDSTGVVSVDDNGGSLTVDVGAALPAGTNNIGDVDIASALPAGTNNIGDVDVASIATGSNVIGQVGLEPRTSGGLTIGPGSGAKQLSAASTNATSVKATAGQVYGWYLYNDGGSEAYLKIYNKASAPTVGTDVPVLVIPIPAGAAANVEFTQGIAFATGIATALTTGAADADTGAVAANQVIVNLFFK